jgi:hypothetical protein
LVDAVIIRTLSGVVCVGMSADRPTGKSAIRLSSPLWQNFLLSRLVETAIERIIPSQQGTFRDRHGREAGCGGREAALLTRVLALRTAKSCGPDASTLASSS